MANVKISQLTAASALAATDQFEVNASGSSVSVTAQKIADFLASVSQTLTNKTFDTAGTGNSFKINGTAVSAVTGTGSVVLAAAPTLAGATVSAALTYGGVTLSNSVTGTGSMVLSASPTLTGTVTLPSTSTFNSTGLGIGVTPSYKLDVSGSSRITGTLSVGGNSPVTDRYLNIEPAASGATLMYGLVNAGTIQSSVTTGYSVYYSGPGTQAAAFTLPFIRHFQANPTASFGAGSTVTNQFGFIAESTMTGATNNYGFFGNIASGTGRYNLYMNGTADNYFAGRLGLNSVGLTTVTFRNALSVTGGAVAYQTLSEGAIQSDVTTLASVYITAPSVVNAAFTLASLHHYRATQSTIGASATVTAQYGFSVSSTLTGAINNYGFHSAIASAANRWNFYASGTASNYFEGATTFNSALTYGGVTLSNSVTGTGSMVLSAGPTFTGTVTTAALTVGSGSALKLGNAYVAGAPTASGYVTIQDSSGTTYKVLVAA